MTNAYTEAREIAAEAIQEAINQGATDPLGIEEAAREFAWQSCDSHEVVIYYHKAIQFCADNDTSMGEQWLNDCSCGITQADDTFGQIACRIAFATLLSLAEEYITEICADMEEAA
jgi:hypothetical protein